MRSLIITALLATLLVGCASGPSLTVRIDGLPDSMPANVRVFFPNGSTMDLNATTRLSDLSNGSYYVLALAVSENGTFYSVSSDADTIVVDRPVVVNVTYERVPTIIPSTTKVLDPSNVKSVTYN